MTTYRIVNRDSGADLGLWEADSKDAALDSMARAAGYRDHAHACEVTASDGRALQVTEQVADLRFTEMRDGVRFGVDPSGQTFFQFPAQTAVVTTYLPQWAIAALGLDLAQWEPRRGDGGDEESAGFGRQGRWYVRLDALVPEEREMIMAERAQLVRRT